MINISKVSPIHSSVEAINQAGQFKGVTSDMAHGQTYNIHVDVKESASGLT